MSKQKRAPVVYAPCSEARQGPRRSPGFPTACRNQAGVIAVDFAHDGKMQRSSHPLNTVEIVGRAQPLGKRARIVSTSRDDQGHENRRRASSRRMDAQEQACKITPKMQGRAREIRKRFTLEKDQPQHVRERVARLRRFQMQDKAAELAGYRVDRQNRQRRDRVADCLRRLSDVASGVECRYNPASHSGYFRGLQTCGSVWHCPVCAAKISEKRRRQLSRLVKAHLEAGGSVWMTTYTVSHKKSTDLAALVENILAARRKMRQGRRGMGLRTCFQVVGTVSVLEVTWSPRHGWHPHIHELVFSSDPNMNPDAYDQAARVAWKDAAAAFGLSMNTHGFQIDKTFGAVADYIAKFGHEPAADLPWGVESEMVKGHMKQARDKDGMTPFGLLAAATDGLEWAVPLWQEYCAVFKGRKQLNYSAGLKQLYGISDETDEELAAEGDEQEGAGPVTLVDLTPAQWDQVVDARARGGLYELMRTGRPGLLVAGLAEIGVEASPPDMVGWHVHAPDGDGEVDLVLSDSYAPGGWRAWVVLDGPGRKLDRMRACALWDLVVLSDGQRERSALLGDASG